MNTETAAPNYLQRKIAVEPNMTSDPINIPVLNVPVRMSLAIPTEGHRGLAEMTIMRTAKPDPCLVWLGADTSTSAFCANTQPRAPDTHLAWIDFAKTIAIRVASESSIEISNEAEETVKVVVTFMW
jgi:hypothetical protein